VESRWSTWLKSKLKPMGSYTNGQAFPAGPEEPSAPNESNE
jgi:hypothetical protein